MKKSLKIYLMAWGVLFAVILFAFVSNGRGTGLDNEFDSVTEDPAYLETLIDVKLPDIVSVDSEHMGGSQLSTYIRYFYFEEPISEDSVRKLKEYCRTDDRHWIKNSDHYCYGDGRGRYHLQCSIYKDYAEVELSINDDFTYAGLFGFLFSFLGFLVLLVWGIALGVVSIIRRTRSN